MIQVMMKRSIQITILIVSLSYMASAQTDSPFLVYGTVSWQVEKSYLDNFSRVLKKEKDMVGVIIYRPGEKDCLKEVKRHIDRATAYLTSRQKISKDRIVTVYAGYGEELTITLQPVSKSKLKAINVDLKDITDVKMNDNCKANRKSLQREKRTREY